MPVGHALDRPDQRPGGLLRAFWVRIDHAGGDVAHVAEMALEAVRLHHDVQEMRA
jgi:hypothetical protein